MAKQSNGRRSAAAAPAAASKAAIVKPESPKTATAKPDNGPVAGIRQAERRTSREWFSAFAHGTAQFTGKPATFIVSVILVLVWAATGPLFNYSDTWQLVINTSTTIVNFLMVFLIQNTQNRDTLALQVKLAELIIAVAGAKDTLASDDDLSEEELEKLHDDYRCRADVTLQSLEERRATKAKA